jgi:hypothetical protein
MWNPNHRLAKQSKPLSVLHRLEAPNELTPISLNLSPPLSPSVSLGASHETDFGNQNFGWMLFTFSTCTFSILAQIRWFDFDGACFPTSFANPATGCVDREPYDRSVALNVGGHRERVFYSLGVPLRSSWRGQPSLPPPPREDGPPVFYLQPCPSFRANGQDLLNDEYRRQTWLSWGLLTSLPPWAGGKPDPIGRWPSSSLSTPLFFHFSFDVFLCFLVVKAQRPKLIHM